MNWPALAPFASLGLAAVAAMVTIALRRSHGAVLAITLAGLGAAGLTLARGYGANPDLGLLFRLDAYARMFFALIAGAAFIVALFAHAYLERLPLRREEFYVLLLIATLGSAALAASVHLVSLFLALEVLSVSLYGLAAYPHHRDLPLEAGIKYLILASAAAAFLLFGMALIYADTGAMDFATLQDALRAPLSPLLACGGALLLAGLGFKLGLVPFHLWTPDVYEGAPAPVTAFFATASKAATVAVLLRFFAPLVTARFSSAPGLLAVLAMASMIGGNLLALRQRNLKRLLAYSSIAHMGYVMVAVEAAGLAAAAAVIGFYFLAYFVTTLAAFGVISALATTAGEPVWLDDYRGLFWRRPALALVLAAMLFSLAGIPLTAGFIAKFYLVAAGAVAARWMLLVTLAVTSTIGLYYYLRAVIALFSPAPEHGEAALALTPRLARTDAWVLGILLVVLIWIGVAPQPFLHWVARGPLR